MNLQQDPYFDIVSKVTRYTMRRTRQETALSWGGPYEEPTDEEVNKEALLLLANMKIDMLDRELADLQTLKRTLEDAE